MGRMDRLESGGRLIPETMNRSVRFIMLTTTVLTGVFVFTGTAAVKVLPEPSTPVGELLNER